MAEFDIGNANGFVDKRHGRGTSGASVLAEQNNYDSIYLLRTRLAALNGTYYTAARMNSMTKNDLIYALRQASSDVAGI